MKKCRLSQLVLLSVLVGSSSPLPEAEADITLPRVIGDHMVLQRDRPLPIWGWADPEEEITVKFGEVTATTEADAQGDWEVVLPAMKADGKVHRMTVSGKFNKDRKADGKIRKADRKVTKAGGEVSGMTEIENKIELEDILIGEVWIGSGQWNMEFCLGGALGGEEAVAAANCPQIRLLHVEKVRAMQPAKDILAAGEAKGKHEQLLLPPASRGPAWKVCTPQNVPRFSAVLYYFGQRLHKDLDVPVGLINSSWSGSPIEAWTVWRSKSGGTYNGMIAPLVPFAIRGVIWHQGEADVKLGLKYADKMRALIKGWRNQWDYDFPFYFVELAPFAGYDASLPRLWEAQAANLKIPGTGMVVTTDLVENIKDICPRNKLEVGNRLALWALAKDYGKKDLVYSGPLYKSMEVDGGKIRLSFAHVGGGLKSRDGKPLAEFEIAAADGKFVPAEATIDGDTVVVQAKEVAAPIQARFGWRNEASPNLINKEGLPASPFETNNWPGGTGE